MPYYFDNYHHRGFSHTICEDYSKSSENVAVLSDGCSSAQNSHIGAMLICENFVLHPKEYLVRSKLIAEQLGYNEDCLHATLGFIRKHKFPTNDKFLDCHLRGDGVIYDGDIFREYNFKYISGDLDIPKGSSLPYYPIYEQWEDKIWTRQEVEFSIKNINENIIDYKHQHQCTIMYFKGNKFVLFSDGVSSFVNEDGRKVPTIEIVKCLTDFKIIDDKFIRRRALKCFKYIFPDLGWKNMDDVAIIGGIYDT